MKKIPFYFFIRYILINNYYLDLLKILNIPDANEYFLGIH